MALSNDSFQPGQPGDVPRSFNAVDDAEYSTYQAKLPININNSRAYNPGDVVPKSLVDNGTVPADYVVNYGEPTATIGHLRTADGTTSNTVANLSPDGSTPEVNPLELGAGYQTSSGGPTRPAEDTEPGGTYANKDASSSGGAAGAVDAGASVQKNEGSKASGSSAKK